MMLMMIEKSETFMWKIKENSREWLVITIETFKIERIFFICTKILVKRSVNANFGLLRVTIVHDADLFWYLQQLFWDYTHRILFLALFVAFVCVAFILVVQLFTVIHTFDKDSERSSPLFAQINDNQWNTSNATSARSIDSSCVAKEYSPPNISKVCAPTAKAYRHIWDRCLSTKVCKSEDQRSKAKGHHRTDSRNSKRCFRRRRHDPRQINDPKRSRFGSLEDNSLEVEE